MSARGDGGSGDDDDNDTSIGTQADRRGLRVYYPREEGQSATDAN